MTSNEVLDRIDHVEGELEKIRLVDEGLASALYRLSIQVTDSIRSTEQFKQGMTEFKEEMKEFKEEMRQSKKDLDKKWGDLANKMGTVVEDFISPNAYNAILGAFGQEMELLWTHTERYRKSDKLRMEIDVIVKSSDTAYLIESKTTASKEGINEFEEKVKSGKFVELFPEFKDLKIVLIFASISIPDKLRTYLFSKNMYPMVLKGDIMEIVLPKN